MFYEKKFGDGNKQYVFYPKPPEDMIHKKLPAGRYSYSPPMMMSPPSFDPLKPNTDVLIPLEGELYEKVRKYIKIFATRKDSYETLDVMWKLSVLFYGEPGTGKTAFIHQMTEELIKTHDALIVETSIYNYNSMITLARLSDPERLIVIVEEDVDDIDDEGILLDFLDGHNSVNGIIFFATTNYIKQVPARFTSRPSRFALVEEMPLPSEKIRRQFLKNRLPKEAHHLITDELIEKTGYMSIDHIKAVCIFTAIYGEDIDSAIEAMRKMQTLARGGGTLVGDNSDSNNTITTITTGVAELGYMR